MTGEELRQAAFGFADSLWNSERERQRRADFLTYATQYIGRPIASLADFEERSASSSGLTGGEGRSARNLTRTLVDTAMSRFAKSETRVQFLTNGGSDDDQEKAEEGTDAANALIEQTGSEMELRKAALHACVFDLGIVKQIYGPDGPESEHVPSWELMFDPADAHRGKPTIRVQRFPGDRDALIVRFLAPVEGETQEEADGREEAIAKLKSSSGTVLSTPDHTNTDQHTIVYELWRDPIGRRPGRHLVVTESVLLLDELIRDKQTKSAPFVLFGYSEPLTGAYPESIGAIVSQLQLEIDGMKIRKQQVLRLMAVPRYLLSGPGTGDADQVAAQLRGGSDAIGDTIIAPPGVTVTPLDPGIAASLAALTAEIKESWGAGFEMCGINPSNATGSRPNGLNSAPSQREWNEIAQDRLSLVALEYQQAHVDLAEMLLDAVAEMPDFEINIASSNGRFLKKLKAAQLNLTKSSYVLQKFPIGALPTTPTGKLAAAGDLLQMGALDKDQFQQIVQLPDLKSRLDINLASQKATAKIVSRMLSSGEYIAPPDCLNRDYALKYCVAKWLEGTADDMDQHRLDLLQNWMDNLTARIAKDSAPPAPAPGPAPGGGGNGGPTVAPNGPPGGATVGRIGQQAIALQPAGIAPLQNSEFAPPPGPMAVAA